VRFDADKITQIIFNLMDNSRKYCAATKAIWVGLWHENGRVVFELQDKGIGIPLKDQKRIFQQFFRGANAQSQGGCGIGLYLVDHIMRAHGGKVEVESQEGTGSRFRLIFPTLQPTEDFLTESIPHPLAHRTQ
jgi:signal transduction histidine kinase